MANESAFTTSTDPVSPEEKGDAAITATPSLEKGTDSAPGSEIKPAEDAMPEAPEGGTKAYLSLIGASTAMFVSFGWVNCIALFQAEYETNQLKQYSSSTISWIPSMECTEIPSSLADFEMLICFSFLHALHVSLGRQNVRQLRSKTSDRYWHLYACLWPHDD